MPSSRRFPRGIGKEAMRTLASRAFVKQASSQLKARAARRRGPYHLVWPSMVKSTYVLDLETAQTLDRLASDWQVSKSEALRRAIRSAGTVAAPDGVTIVRRLQQAVQLDRAGADQWAETVRVERRTGRRGAAAAARPRRQR